MSRSIHHTAGHMAATHPAFGLFNALRDMAAVSRQRKTLADLPAHLLSDIGISESAALAEAARAPWDVPAHWRR
ncbi:DUF1127 domain-containing protein [Yoonia sp.]|uniref:DUF1127 domain-containing protein n=1 Tax=Yoonia sp. TaxID=2212373 RepID=UPI002FDB91DC